jgi:hypothetical protein
VKGEKGKGKEKNGVQRSLLSSPLPFSRFTFPLSGSPSPFSFRLTLPRSLSYTRCYREHTD